MAGVLLGGCGGDAPDNSPPGSADNPALALPNPAPTRIPPTSEAQARRSGAAQGKPRAQESLVEGQRRVQAQNEISRTKAKPATKTVAGTVAGQPKQLAPTAGRPCSLVPKSTATEVIGTPLLEPVQARQGPTCIYRSRNGKHYVTLMVQRANYSRLAAKVRRRREVTIATRRGVCGTFGGPVLYVPVAARRVLTIGGSCSVATRFAARALASL